MIEIKLVNHPDDRASFNLYVNHEVVAEMDIKIFPDVIKVYHTLVNADQRGKGYAKQLFTHLVDYARTNKLKIIPICEYVHAQFSAHPELFAGVWQHDKQG